MPKLKTGLRFYPSNQHGFIDCSFPYNENLISDVKEIPGVAWNKSAQRWRIPQETTVFVVGMVLKRGLTYCPQEDNLACSNYPTIPEGRINPTLHPYQIAAVKRVFRGRRLLINFETGLGKTVVAIEVCRLLKLERVLVISPAIVRDHWQAEFQRWWPDNEWVVQGNGIGEVTSQIINTTLICSYGKLPNEILKWDAIIIDESHFIKNPKSSRSKKIREICRNNSSATILALTATPIANDPKDLWHQIECLWPGRVGSYWKFCSRYSNMWNNGYGMSVAGLNEANHGELKTRLETMAVQVTKAEVSHLLPPFSIQRHNIKPSKRRKFIPREEPGGEIRQHQEFIDPELIRAGGPKLSWINTFVDIERESSRIAVVTYFKDTAKEISKNIAGPCQLITGDMPIKKRLAAIAKTKANPKAILVASMKSIGTGIDLVEFSTVIFAELYYSPAVMIQALGRFYRLGSKLAVNVVFPIQLGTLDEYISEGLKTKIENINKVLKGGSGERQMQAAFETTKEEEKDFLTRIAEVSNTAINDEYL